MYADAMASCAGAPGSVMTHHADAVDKAVAALRYGSVNINVVTMLGFCVPKLTWGAYPGNTPQACPCIVFTALFSYFCMQGCPHSVSSTFCIDACRLIARHRRYGYERETVAVEALFVRGVQGWGSGT